MDLTFEQWLCLEATYLDKHPEIINGFADDTPERQQYFLGIAERIGPQVLKTVCKLSDVHKMFGEFKSEDENLMALVSVCFAGGYRTGLPDIAKPILRDLCGDLLAIETALKSNEISHNAAIDEMVSLKNAVKNGLKHAVGKAAKNIYLMIPPSCDEIVDLTGVASLQWQRVMEQELENILESYIPQRSVRMDMADMEDKATSKPPPQAKETQNHNIWKNIFRR